MMEKFDGKIFVVTGGASGIGRAVVMLLAQAGASVVVSDVNAAGAEATAHAAGQGAIAVPCDVTDSAQVEALMQAAVGHFGTLDGTFNNAGVGGTLKALHEIDEALWDSVMNVNVRGVWLCMKYAVPHLLARGGSIVNTASVAGLIAFRGNASYAASKHAVIGLTRSAAHEYGRAAIRVNAVCPGFTDTPMLHTIEDERPGMLESALRAYPLRRMGTADEIAEAVVWLLSDASSYVTGVALPIDGGVTSG